MSRYLGLLTGLLLVGAAAPGSAWAEDEVSVVIRQCSSAGVVKQGVTHYLTLSGYGAYGTAIFSAIVSPPQRSGNGWLVPVRFYNGHRVVDQGVINVECGAGRVSASSAIVKRTGLPETGVMKAAALQD